MSQFFASGGQSIGLSTSAISPSNEHLGLISFRIAWFDLAVQGTLKGLLQQFKSINSSVLSFLYSPTLTSIHDHWKNHSLDQMDLCWQSNFSADKMLLFLTQLGGSSLKGFAAHTKGQFRCSPWCVN